MNLCCLVTGFKNTYTADTSMAKLSCRFYQHKFPEQEDVVMVKVHDIADMGAYVHLLEYNNIEGMVLLSELSRRRIRSINKLIRKGRDECVVVIRVDKDKGQFPVPYRLPYPSFDDVRNDRSAVRAVPENNMVNNNKGRPCENHTVCNTCFVC